MSFCVAASATTVRPPYALHPTKRTTTSFDTAAKRRQHGSHSSSVVVCVKSKSSSSSVGDDEDDDDDMADGKRARGEEGKMSSGGEYPDVMAPRPMSSAYLPGLTRSVYERDHAVITQESRVWCG